MIGGTHAERPGTVIGLIGALSGADKAMIVIALKMQLPSGAHAKTEAKTASQTGIKAVVITLYKVVCIANERTGIISHIHIAVTPLPTDRSAINGSCRYTSR